LFLSILNSLLYLMRWRIFKSQIIQPETYLERKRNIESISFVNQLKNWATYRTSWISNMVSGLVTVNARFDLERQHTTVILFKFCFCSSFVDEVSKSKSKLDHVLNQWNLFCPRISMVCRENNLLIFVPLPLSKP